MELGKLEKVDLRDIWATEDGDFTPWLATQENIKILGDTIGLELEIEGQEKEVGPFRADILCQDTGTGHWVLIENQLAKTDHSHLGQLLTYAAGLNAVTIVWIAAKITDEHRAALDWLNEKTSSDINFFGLEIELWRIGNSNTAPKFNIVSNPNNWSKTISEAATRIQTENLTDTRKLQLEFWTSFKEFILLNSKVLRPQKPCPQHWYSFAIGRSQFHMSATLNMWDKQIAVILILSGINAKPHYYLLEKQKDAIEKELNYALEWRELPENKESRITIRLNTDTTDKTKWANQQQWFLQHLEDFYKVIGPRIKALNSNDYHSPACDSVPEDTEVKNKSITHPEG